MARILIVPGLHDSGPDHWQSWMERELPASERVKQRDWSAPDIIAWAASVRDAVEGGRGAVWIIAHSFGCLAAVRAAADVGGLIAGALLVAPAEPTKLGITAGAVPEGRLPFPSFLVASRNDPWMTFESARHWSWRWGSRLVDAGVAGHINPESGYGPWPGGLHVLRRLQAQAEDVRRSLVEGY
jgi:predicted alpha/beta hydrolase family esterase